MLYAASKILVFEAQGACLPSFLVAQTEVLKLDVTVQSACLGKGGPAVCAAKGPLARVHPLVRDEI